MSDTDKLMAYILTLTPEQVDKVVSQIPRLTELLSESAQPCLQAPSAQIATLYREYHALGGDLFLLTELGSSC